MARTGESLRDLPLGATGIDRDADARSDAELLPRLLADPATRVLALIGDRAPVSGDELALRAPAAGDAEASLLAYLGRDAAGVAHLLAHWPAPDEPDAEGKAGTATLRAAGTSIPGWQAALFATGLGLANWHRTHRHCPRCGARTEVVSAGWVTRCPQDESMHFPRTDPAVIMSVVDDDDRLLLAKGAGFKTAGMSVLAGFLEPGETLAAAVAREVKEEVGLDVTDVRYLGDQPWPFPASLMIGFTARALPGELTLQVEEIETARWFTRDELRDAVASGDVLISSRLSIARHIIEHWYGGPLDAPEVTLRR